MACPLLPLTGVSQVLLWNDPFVRQVQTALAQAARLLNRPDWDPGPIDGHYGPKTATALLAFSRSLPPDETYQRLLQLVGVPYATCSVLRRLQVPCTELQATIGVTGGAATVYQIQQAAQRGQLSLACPIEPPPPPSEPPTRRELQPWHYVALAVGAVVVGGALYVAWRQLQAGSMAA